MDGSYRLNFEGQLLVTHRTTGMGSDRVLFRSRYAARMVASQEYEYVDKGIIVVSSFDVLWYHVFDGRWRVDGFLVGVIEKSRSSFWAKL